MSALQPATPLHIDIKGQGPALVLIHGWGMHGGVWQPLLKRLSAHFTLHVIDLPGMGLSQSAIATDLDEMVAAIVPLLPEKSHLLGWSLGGLVAMRIAHRYPQRVNKLVLVGSTPRFINTAEDAVQPWQFGMQASVFEKFARQVEADYAATLLKFLTLQCMGADDARSTIKQLRVAIAARPEPSSLTLQAALDVLLNNDLRPLLASLTLPVLLIHGDRDTLAPVQAAHWLAQHLAHAQLRVIAGAGHAPFLSHQQAFTTALLDFLQTAPNAT